MSLTDDLFQRVSDAARDTAFLVERTDSGFDVRANVADTKWYAVMYQEGIKKVFTHHVAVDEAARSYRITDDSYRVDWRGGVESEGGVPKPVLRASAGRSLGTFKEVSFQRTYAVSEEGKYEKVVDYTFSTEDGRRLITGPAQELGLTQRTDNFTKAGIVFAAIGLLIAVLVVLGLVFFR